MIINESHNNHLGTLNKILNKYLIIVNFKRGKEVWLKEIVTCKDT